MVSLVATIYLYVCDFIELQTPVPVPDVIPTTVNDISHYQLLATSPLKKYKLTQVRIDNGTNCDNGTAAVSAMLSPREPRTLGDLMQHTPSAALSKEETTVLNPNRSPLKDHMAFNQTRASGLSPLNKQLSPQRPLVGNTLPELTNRIGFTHSAMRTIDLNYPHSELKRSVSLVDDTLHHRMLYNGYEEGGGDGVHNSFDQEPCDGPEYAPNTPPMKKKVLSDRKLLRMDSITD